MKRFFAVSLCVLLIAVLAITPLLLLSGCDDKKEEKKAIVMMHGIGCGGFYDAETDDPVFCFSDFNSAEILNFITLATDFEGENGLINRMAVNEDGTKKDDGLRTGTMDDPTVYTVGNLFENMFDELEDEYSDDYDVLTFQYDWRLSTDTAAADLENYVKDYDKVVLITHSMGGLVVSSFLQKEANRAKVEKFIPISAPFYGAMDTVYFMYEGLFSAIGEMLSGNWFDLAAMGNIKVAGMTLNAAVLIDGIIPKASYPKAYDKDGRLNLGVAFDVLMSKLDSPEIVSLMKSAGVSADMIFDILKGIGKNMYSLYDLFPTEQFFADLSYGLTDAPIEVEDDNLTYAEFMTYLTEDSYLKTITNFEAGGVKPQLSTLQAYQNAKYVDGKHVSTLVDTYYISGYGVKTLTSVEVEDDDENEYEFNRYGDGLVSVWSATLGKYYGGEAAITTAIKNDGVFYADNIMIVGATGEDDGRVGTSHAFVAMDKRVIDKVSDLIDKLD